MTGIKLEVIDTEFSVCKLKSADQIETGSGFFFAARTSDEISLVCDTGSVPEDAVARSDGWKALGVTKKDLPRAVAALRDAGYGI